MPRLPRLRRRWYAAAIVAILLAIVGSAYAGAAVTSSSPANSWRLWGDLGDGPHEADCLASSAFTVESFGAAVAPVPPSESDISSGLANGALEITSVADEDADVRFSSRIDVWSSVLGAYSTVASDYGELLVPAHGTAKLQFQADVMRSDMGYDYSRVRLSAKVEGAREAGTSAVCG